MSEAFGSIFNKIGKLIFNDEYLKAKEEEAKNQPQAQANPTIVAPTPIENSTTSTSIPVGEMSAAANADMISKVHALVDSMNKPGIDFLELWDAAEAMGAVNAVNISNAYTALKIASGNTLNKNIILQTGQAYCQELSQALANDVQQKRAEKERLESNYANQLKNANAEVDQLTSQLNEIQKLLNEKKKVLEQLNKGVQPEIQDIDFKIAAGQNAVNTVIAEMQQVLSLAQSNIKD